MNSMIEEMVVYKTDLSNRKLDVLWCTNCWTRETYVTTSNGDKSRMLRKQRGWTCISTYISERSKF